MTFEEFMQSLNPPGPAGLTFPQAPPSEADQVAVGPQSPPPALPPPEPQLANTIPGMPRNEFVPGPGPGGFVDIASQTKPPNDQPSGLPWDAQTAPKPQAPPPTMDEAFGPPAPTPSLAPEQLASPPAPQQGGGGRRGPVQDPFAKQYTADMAMREQGVARGAESRAQQAEFTGEQNRQNLLANAARQAEDEKFMQGVFAKADARSQALQQEVADIANTRIDPNRRWHEATTAGKIATIATLALGGWVGAKTGRNSAMEMFNKVVNDDISAQVTDLETRRAGVSMKSNLMQADLQRGMNMHEVKAKYTALAYDNIAKTIEAQASKFTGEQERAKGMELAGEARMQGHQVLQAAAMETKRVAIAAAGQAETKRNNMARLAEDARQFDLGLQAKKDTDLAKGQAETDKGKAAQDALTFEHSQTGHYAGIARNEEALKAAEKIAVGHGVALQALGDYRDAVLKYEADRPRLGGPALDKAALEIKAKYAAVFKAMRDWSASGANLTEPEIENIIVPMAPKPQGRYLGFTDPAGGIDASLEVITNSYNASMKPYFRDYQPIQTNEERGGKTRAPGLGTSGASGAASGRTSFDERMTDWLNPPAPAGTSPWFK